MGGICYYLGEKERFPGIGPPLTFWPFMASLGTVTALVMALVFFSLPVYHGESVMRFKINGKSDLSPS